MTYTATDATVLETDILVIGGGTNGRGKSQAKKS